MLVGGLARSLLSTCRRPAKSHVFPSFADGNKHTLRLSNGTKSIEIKMRRPDRSKLMSGFWEHKLLSPSLWALGMQSQRRHTSQLDDAAGAEPRPPRRMADSYCEETLPFRSDPRLCDDYTSIYGGIRVGKLLEDLDVLAASIAYLHCDDIDLTIVTAAVDRLDLLVPIDTFISDIRLRGSVTYVGRSSIEATISVETDQHSQPGGPPVWDVAALAKFILVARSPSGAASVEVNRLLLETPREREIHEAGRARHEWRLRRSANSLFKLPPGEEEIRLVHDICMGSGQAPVGVAAGRARLVPMASTQTSSLRLCHPQERNIHNFIFGGYLSREACELAFANATLFFGGRRPSLKTIDDIAFVHPVPIGSIVEFKSEVVHSRVHGGLVYAFVQVVTDVLRAETGTRLTTNTYHFALAHPLAAFGDAPVPFVQPGSYVEAMKYLEGKRRADFDLEVAPQTGADAPPHYDPATDVAA